MGFRDELIEITKGDSQIYDEALSIIEQNIEKETERVINDLKEQLIKCAKNKTMVSGYFVASSDAYFEPLFKFNSQRIENCKSVMEELGVTHTHQPDGNKHYDMVFTIPTKKLIFLLFKRIRELDKTCSIQMYIVGSVFSKYKLETDPDNKEKEGDVDFKLPLHEPYGGNEFLLTKKIEYPWLERVLSYSKISCFSPSTKDKLTKLHIDVKIPM